MGRLIDDLLAFSRVGRTQLARSRVDLNLLVQQAKQELSADINEELRDLLDEVVPILRRVTFK